MQARRRLGKERDPNSYATTLPSRGQVWVKQEFRVLHKVNVQFVTGGLILDFILDAELDWVSLQKQENHSVGIFFFLLYFDVRKHLINTPGA